jgi:hypothetical protein
MTAPDPELERLLTKDRLAFERYDRLRGYPGDVQEVVLPYGQKQLKQSATIAENIRKALEFEANVRLPRSPGVLRPTMGRATRRVSLASSSSSRNRCNFRSCRKSDRSCGTYSGYA